MISAKIYQAAIPFLQEKTLTDFRLGIHLACCQLSDGSIGISHMFLEDIMENTSVYDVINSAIGKSATKIASKLINGSALEKTMAITVLNAVSTLQNLSDDTRDNTFALDVKSSDQVAFVGRIPSVIQPFEKRVSKIRIYDMGLEAHGGALDLSPMSNQKEGLNESDVVIITGTSILNNTIDGLLDMSVNARDIVIVGPTTPMFPTAFQGTRVTRLAGTVCISDSREELFTKIARGCNVLHLSNYVQKKCQLISV